MRNLFRHLRLRPFRARSRFFRDEQGATAVEYAVMLAMIILTALVSIVALGNSTQSSWQNTNTRLNSVGFGS